MARGAALAAVAACARSSAPPAPEPVPATPVPADTAALHVTVNADTLPSPPMEDVNAPPEPELEGTGRVVRIALEAGVPRATLSSTGEWKLYDSDGASTLLHGTGSDAWIVDAERGGLRASRLDGSPTPVRPAPFVARPMVRGSFVMVNGKRYRGEIVIVPAPGGVAVINRLYLEDYLRGVVPLEIGKRDPDEFAAIEAQAVAARSYAYTHLADTARPYDMQASVLDQAYGGADAETPLTDRAVFETRRLVLTYGGRIVNAPYHSTCGGSTAALSEVWRSGDEPYLVSVSDRIPGTVDRFYCDESPRFRWTRTYDGSSLAAALDRYLRSYASVPGGRAGTPRAVEIESRTASGRVRTLVITTDRGRYRVRGDDIRFVLRNSGGQILNSTYFSVRSERDGRGSLERLVITGSGYGHGVGMCQWGAIGRARAGQDYRTILRTYYPGTIVATVDE